MEKGYRFLSFVEDSGKYRLASMNSILGNFLKLLNEWYIRCINLNIIVKSQCEFKEKLCLIRALQCIWIF